MKKINILNNCIVGDFMKIFGKNILNGLFLATMLFANVATASCLEESNDQSQIEQVAGDNCDVEGEVFSDFEGNFSLLSFMKAHKQEIVKGAFLTLYFSCIAYVLYKNSTEEREPKIQKYKRPEALRE